MKILLGLSGGVDSTYSALKLKNEGHEVEGAVVLMHEYTEASAAEESAASLGIPLHIIDAREEFEKIVKQNFIFEYTHARTPNPCVICNSEVKFIKLLEYAESNGFDMIATGHYAGVVKLEDGTDDRYAIKRGLDEKKDQTYMLWRLPQRVLSKLMLPLSGMMKSEIREQSRTAGLSAADRTDSQEICFLPDGNYAEFIESRAGTSIKGSFIDEAGNVLGEHKGIIHYTVGQRRGLGISAASRIFVTKIDPVSNTVTLSPNDSFATHVGVSGIVYSGMKPLYDGEELNLSVKLRYAARPTAATVKFFGDRAEVLLAEPVRAVTPGQSAVFYDGDLLLAGGFIDTAKS